MSKVVQSFGGRAATASADQTERFSAPVVPLPGAAPVQVEQRRGPGPWPRCVTRLSKAKSQRESARLAGEQACQRQSRVEVLRRAIQAGEEMLAPMRAELAVLLQQGGVQ